jgi:hypothetical protein
LQQPPSPIKDDYIETNNRNLSGGPDCFANLCTISPASRPQPPTSRALSVSHRRPAEHMQTSSSHHGHTPEECARATFTRTGYTNTPNHQKAAYSDSECHYAHEHNDRLAHNNPLLTNIPLTTTNKYEALVSANTYCYQYCCSPLIL